MKTILTSLTAILLCSLLRAQIVNIPDAKFKAYLVGNSSINTNGDSEIDAAEAAVFSGTISVGTLAIIDLTGIEAFAKIKVLDCGRNKLTSLNISKNTALTKLQCSDNLLTSLDISKNIALTVFNCTGNKLTSLDVSKNTVLEWVDIFDNKLTSLDISKNTALSLVWCSSNSISSLDVSKNTVLTRLFCDNNSLTSLDVSNNTALEILLCNNNKITSLDVSQHKALTGLRCDGNSLTSLDVSNGNNGILSIRIFTNNPSLNCIQVDNETWANANWLGEKDNHAVYSNDCKTIGIDEISLDEASITSYSKTITIFGTTGTITVFGLLGQQVHQSQLTSGANNITIDGSGVYLVMVQTVKGIITKKVYLN